MNILVVFPSYKGSTLRGMFKTALRRVCCPSVHVPCNGCSLARECVYGTVTEHRTKTGENTVLPYVLNCSELKSNSYAKGETLSFDLVLVGRAVSYLPHIIASLSAWDMLDVGRFQPLVRQGEIERYGPPARWSRTLKPKGRLKLMAVEQVSEDGVYALYGPQRPFRMPSVETLSCESGIDERKWRVKLNFISPTRITRRVLGENGRKRKKKLIQPEDFDFHLFFNSIRTRIYGLHEHFGNGTRPVAETALEDMRSDLDTVRVAENGLKMEKIRRYRGNMSKWVHLDGFVGPVTVENVPGSLMPWIMAGGVLHIGRFPTLGYGEYGIEHIGC